MPNEKSHINHGILDNKCEYIIKSITSELECLEKQTIAFLNAHLIPNEIILHVQLVIEELVLNIIQYAYPKDKIGEIKISLEILPKQIVLIIEDTGKTFDPSHFPEPDITLSLENRKAGGLGIHIIRKVTSHFEYKHQNNTNKTICTFDI